MNFVKEARELVDYIKRLESFNTIIVSNKPTYSHIGGLFTDIVLQSGLNYKNVVKPRVLHVIKNYPEAKTVNGFAKAINIKGINHIINWNHPVKIKRILDLISFSQVHSINTCKDLSIFLKANNSRLSFLSINGFGPKTLDYTLKLLSFDTVAIDRHITLFVNQAGLNIKDYYSLKNIVEYAADFMNISRSSLDFSIWKYMSTGQNKNDQLKLSF